MRLAWILNRLRSMEPAELVHRVVEKARQAASRHRHEGWARFAAGGAATWALPGLREAVLKASAADRAAIAEAADRTLAGAFEALGRNWPQRQPAALFPAELWRLDPVTGGLWPGPERYCFDIDFRHNGALGDIKYVWEINRLQFLVPLAARTLADGHAPSLVAIEAAIASWYHANPPFGGTAWASGIEVALRAISLLLVLALAGERLSADGRRRIGEILAASAFWLARFPSRYSSANNHLVAELCGLFLLGMARDGSAEGPRQALLAEIERQILPDGVGAEQSPSYAGFTVELTLLAAVVARAAGAPFPAAFDARIAAFAGFVDWLAPTPAIGDDDEGRVLTLGGHEADYPRSVAAAIAGFLGQPGAVVAADFRGLLLGRPTTATPPPEGLRSFVAGGYSIWHGTLSGRPVDLVFDHGPLGYLSIAAHGHADALALTLAVDGAPVLVDPGTYLYGSGGAWRDWFRGTPAHNTLNLDGQSQSTISGAFNWSHKAKARLEAAEAGPDWRLAASHDGYLRRFGVRHERQLVGSKDGIDIVDRLVGGPARPAELVFQLAAGLETEVDGTRVTIRRDGRAVLALQFASPDFTVAAGGEAPGSGGWVSTRFGSRSPAPRLAWRGMVGADAIVTRLRIPAADALDTPRSET